MNELIYFPYINVPPTDWTLRALIYYDSLSSIVPRQYFYNPEKHYEKHMLELIRNELVIPIDPVRSLKKPWEIVEPYIKYITQSEKELDVRRKNFKANKTFKIHFDKFEHELYYKLEQLGIAKIDHKKYEWWIVELKTSRELMTFLAVILGEKLNLGLTTDVIEYRNIKFSESEVLYLDSNIEHRRELILKELIPFPEKIDFSKLRKFKDKHHDLLLSFRNKVEQLVFDNNMNLESNLINEKLLDIKLRKEELTARMNESQFKNIFFGTVCGVVGAFQGMQSANTTGAIIGALPGFATAIYSALKIERPDKIFDQTGVKYLALVDKQLRKRI